MYLARVMIAREAIILYIRAMKEHSGLIVRGLLCLKI